jgi:hypothetical protein
LSGNKQTTAKALIPTAVWVKVWHIAAPGAWIGEYTIEDEILEVPKNWPIPDSVPRPDPLGVGGEGTRTLEKGDIFPAENGHEEPRRGI